MKDARTAPARDLVPHGAEPTGTTALGLDALDAPASLPREHPAWQRDLLSVSARVRTILAQLQPAIVRVLSFWDHVAHHVRIGPRRLEIDPSGSYRLR